MAQILSDALPDLADRRFVVTGANGGLGFETARALARRGARVTLACRDAGRARGAVEAIRAESPRAAVDAVALDLASLDSVRACAHELLAREGGLHGLVNNAGVMALPRRTTADGFEMQLGTNHLGHFALTGLLLERLLATPGARVVNVSSTMHKIGRMAFDDLQGERSYGKWRAYGQSKLANLLFTFELQRRLEHAGAAPGLIAAAAHPGYAATNLQFAGPRMEGSRLLERGAALLNRLFSQSAEMGALPALHAAAHPDVRGGDYLGPGGFAEMWGPPTRVKASRRARHEADARRLWSISEELTGVRFALAG
jgi:NAD(P)-dependent dehydrogenase (short-subunit alcohol dehydrogenase family)